MEKILCGFFLLVAICGWINAGGVPATEEEGPGPKKLPPFGPPFRPPPPPRHIVMKTPDGAAVKAYDLGSVFPHFCYDASSEQTYHLQKTIYGKGGPVVFDIEVTAKFELTIGSVNEESEIFFGVWPYQCSMERYRLGYVSTVCKPDVTSRSVSEKSTQHPVSVLMPVRLPRFAKIVHEKPPMRKLGFVEITVKASIECNPESSDGTTSSSTTTSTTTSSTTTTSEPTTTTTTEEGTTSSSTTTSTTTSSTTTTPEPTTTTEPEEAKAAEF